MRGPASIDVRGLWLLALPLPVASWTATGMQGRVVPTLGQWLLAAAFCVVAMLVVFLYHLCITVRDVRDFVNARSGQIDLGAIWHRRPVVHHALVCAGLMLWVHATMVGIPVLADIHRQTAGYWNDGTLWQLEEPFFDWMRGLQLGPAAVKALDLVYASMWIFVIGALVHCVVRREISRAVEMTITVGLLFYARLGIAIIWPTAGPAIYQPGHFAFLAGSTSAELQEMLLQYHQGVLAQNGLMPGLVAMPSLHIGFTWLAVRHLVAVVPQAKVPALAWLLVTWVTTAVLGWHYLLDGFGGIAAAMLCGAVARRIGPSVMRRG